MPQTYPWQEAPKADFAVIGDPVSHSLSPQMHEAAYRALELPYKYVAIRVPPHEVGMALQHLSGLGYVGANITVPHKEEVLLWTGSVDSFAKRVRAANTVHMAARQAINTDGPGFMDTLNDLNVNQNSRVLVLGAGGSARSIVTALLDAGYSVGLWNRTYARAQAMLDEFDLEATLHESIDLEGYDVVVNATASGIADDDLGIDWSKANKSAIAYDLYYANGLTPYLNSASAAGLKCIDGRHLLVAQGARSFEWWLDKQAPREAMMNAIR
ncbi:MAG: shikimate dehydrogenase [Fimbriimonadaceae bacterium]|nr:shikimate dehydrogenase [Fimbriimonadaceae bacterium]